MKITSDIKEQWPTSRTPCSLFHPICRFVWTSILFAFSPLAGLGFTYADEAVQKGASLVGQREQPFATAVSESSGSGETSDKHLKDEVHCLALNIYFEARSEPEMGQRAVGHVVMNRVAHPGYPDSVCQVVRQGGEKRRHRCQFSWWCDGQSDKPSNRKAWNQSLELARKIYQGTLKDITEGALWYHATYAKPYWSKVLLQGDKIGQHIFYHENRRSERTM